MLDEHSISAVASLAPMFIGASCNILVLILNEKHTWVETLGQADGAAWQLYKFGHQPNLLHHYQALTLAINAARLAQDDE